MIELNQLIAEEKITIQLMDEIYKEYGFAFVIRDGKIKGFTRQAKKFKKGVDKHQTEMLR